MRQRAGAIPQQSRTATGVLVQRLDANDRIKDVALVPTISDDDQAGSAHRAGMQRALGGAAGVAQTLRGGDKGTAYRGDGQPISWAGSVVLSDNAAHSQSL